MSDPITPPTSPPVMIKDPSLIEGLGTVAFAPLSIRNVFILLTRAHWSDAENFGDFREKMAAFIWSKDPKLSKLFIDFDYNYDPKNLDRRPAIFVGTSDFDFQKTVVDNVKAVTEDRGGEEGVKHCVTRIIIRHIGKTPNDSWLMGEMTAQYFIGIRRLIMEQMKPIEFEVSKLMASKPFEHTAQQADQQFMVDLVMILQFNAIWLTMRESHRIKTVGFKQSLVDLSV